MKTKEQRKTEYEAKKESLRAERDGLKAKRQGLKDDREADKQAQTEAKTERLQVNGIPTFTVREDGKNGTVAVHNNRIVRTVKKTFGKEDVLTIPMKAVTGVFHDRKSLGTDSVKLTAGSATYEWKVANAEIMVKALEDALYSD